MTHPADPPLPTALPPAVLPAWLAQSWDLLALTDSAGRLCWANAAFGERTGLQAPADLLALAPPDWHGGGTRRTLEGALAAGLPADTELALRSAAGTTLWVRARISRVGAQWLWTLHDTTSQRELAARAQQQSELLDMAQEFGRLGVWEREIPSGKGRWDRHVFGFWGLDPNQSTPDFAEAASRIHPDDLLVPVYDQSTRRAGRYAQRYRVRQPDGSVRWIHSHWEVKNSAEGRPDRAIGIMVDDTEVYELARSLDSTASQLRLAAELAHIVIWRHDLRTQRVHYNDEGFGVLGIPHRVGGVPIDEARRYTHPDDVAKLDAAAAQALRSGGLVDVETRHRRADGQWRYMLVRRVVERGPSGEALAFVGVSLDVTDQVQPTRRAEELARRLEAAAEAARIGIWITKVGSFETEWNAQMYELFDMVGSDRPPTFSQWLDQRVHPDDAARVSSAVQAYLQRQDGALELEFRIRLRDARVRWMMLRADIDRSSSDTLRLFGIVMDVTERHTALAALHQASTRAALIARSAGIGTWETDEDGKPALWDEQMFRLRGLEPRATGLERDEWMALVHPDDRARLLDANPDGHTGTQALAYEFRVRQPDGQYRWLASRSTALRDEHGKVVRRVGVNWDVTEARNAELARQQALLSERESRAKSQFLSRMSHELRTPLNAVLGFTQLLQLEARQSHAVDRLVKLEHIRAAGERLLTLVNDALDLSSLEAGTLQLDLQPVALAAAIAQALPLVAELAAAHQVSVRAGRTDGAAFADPARLQQVLFNLLTNAIKYNRPGGQVIVEAGGTGPQVHLSVRDTGRGLRPEQLAQLFEPFTRLGSEGEGIEGSGIGLAIVKALVGGMGGHVGVSSQPGQGTLVELTLPAPDWRAASPAPGAAAAPLPRRERAGQLLYIEDNSVNVLLVEELVKSLSGLQIVSEPTGTLGVARALSLRPDVILIDMQLPDFDGFEVLRQLRARPETAAIPCIALSANAMPDDIERGLASGFDDYWTKPIKFKPFLDALGRLFPADSAA